jgi:hypothetical protein
MFNKIFYAFLLPLALFSVSLQALEFSDFQPSDKFYRYSSASILPDLTKVTVDDGHAEDIDSLDGVSERFVFYVTTGEGTTHGKPLYLEKWQVNLQTLKEEFLLNVSFSYTAEGQLTHQKVCDLEGNFWVLQYDEQGEPVGVVDQEGNAVLFQPKVAHLSVGAGDDFGLWWLPYYLYDYLVYLLSVLNEAVNSIQNQLMTYSGFRPEFEKIGHDLVGKTLFLLAGYNTEEITQGVVGKGEVNDHVRISHINGILNAKEHTLQSAELISETHGDVNVHYTYRPTQGVTLDLIKCFLVKILGYTSLEAYTLADQWRRLLNEMDEEGEILHYAHSIGATETSAARLLLTPEEQRRIRVYTFGSPSLIANEGFRSVVNYVSRRDGVCFFDPIGYIQGLISSDSNVIFIGDFNGMPMVDHLLHGASYRSIVEALGEEFVEQHGEAPR